LMALDESIQGAVGGAQEKAGVIPKQRYSELPNRSAPNEIPSEIESAINVALFQAQVTYRMSTQLSEFQAEIRREIMEFMFEIQGGVRGGQQANKLPVEPQQPHSPHQCLSRFHPTLVVGLTTGNWRHNRELRPSTTDDHTGTSVGGKRADTRNPLGRTLRVRPVLPLGTHV